MFGRPLSPNCRLSKFEDIDTNGHLYNNNVMEQISYAGAAPSLDAIFSALADPTRRAILSRLVDGELAVKEIAAPFDMSQPAVSRHLKVLERAGLIERDIDEQRRPARLKADNLAVAVGWLADFRPMWGTSFAKLDDLLVLMKQSNNEENPYE